jgi:membrane-bound metal-dependent hydrolase YbcI (DUF457 family)
MTPFSHAALGLLGWKISGGRRDPRSLSVFVFVACAVDLDFVLYYALGRPEIFRHQLYSHNLLVTVLLALPFFAFLRTARERWGLLLTGSSHLLLDIFVIDTLPPIGFRPLYPFFNGYVNVGLFPYVGKETWASVFSWHNILVLGLEALVFVVPALLLARKELAGLWSRKDRGSRSGRADAIS